MRTEQYIEELLYRYNCVVIPEFGAFLTQKKSAELDEASNTFTPPTKIVSFNQQVNSNDGLLITYIATAEKSTFEVVLQALTKEVEHWKRMLKLGQRIKFGSVGELFLNEDQKIQFLPANQVNYLTTSFGLSAVVASPITREVLKEEVVTLEEEVPFIITPEKRKTKTFRPYLKYAAIALLAISTGLTGLRYYNTTVAIQEIAQQDGSMVFKAANSSKQARAMAGTYRALVANMVQGVSQGFEKKLSLFSYIIRMNWDFLSVYLRREFMSGE